MSASQARRGPAHVLLTTDAVGGVWTYALDLARGLAADDVRITLAVLGPSASADQTTHVGFVPGIELVDTGLPLDWLATDRTGVRRAAQGIADLARQRGVDLVQLNSPALAAEASFPAPVVGVAHSCVKTWWEAVERGPLPADFQWRSELLAAGYAACDLVLAPSAAFAAATERAHGVRPEVVWNGRSAPEAAPAVRRARRVVTAGRLWDRGKDVATLDAAAARLDAPVLAYGGTQGPHGESCDFAHLELVGSVDAGVLAAQLAQAGVFASTALYEPFGLAVLEAAQAGCALVLSDIPTFRELWSEAAVLVPPRDAGAIAEALQRLLDDADEMARMAAAAQARAVRYRVEPFVCGVQAAYASLCGSREAAA